MIQLRLALFSALIAVAVSPRFAFAEATKSTAATASHELSHELADKVNKTKLQIMEADSEKRRILGSLYSIQQRMKKITHEKSHLTDELFQAQDNVKNIAKVIAALEEEIGKQKIQLRKRLRAVYKLSGEGYVGALFASRDINQIDETLRFLKIVTESDYRLIQSYQQNVEAYKKQKEKLKGQVERLVGIEKRIKKQEGLLTVEQNSKSQIVSKLDRDRMTSINTIKSLRKKTPAEIAERDEMADLLKPSIFEQKGQLPSPLVGEVVQDFGLMTDERYRIQYSHKGWTMVAPGADSPVSAVFDGSIARAEWIPGYGTTVVIDHGDHYYSVYAHISRLKAKLGDNLKKGQSFAEAGPLGARAGNGLYFELRHFSEAENPAAWIAPKGFQISPANKDEHSKETAAFETCSERSHN